LYHRCLVGGRSAWEWLWWTAWLIGVVLTASQNRGGMLALLVSGAVVLAFAPRARWWKIGLVAAMLGSAALLVDIEIDLGRRRQVSGRQLVANAASIISGSDSRNLSGTKEWRLLWWRDIVDYTVRGEYFWTGKGFGVNLASADGYQLDDQQTLRSPHNGHLTILARAGVPGLSLWLLLQAVFGASLIRAYWRARSRGEYLWARVDLWVLGFWVAFLVNASFDVFLEGPQGGIWFWSLFGFGIAVVEAQREGEKLLDARGMPG
jgi:O-antigen ligase